MRTMGTWAAFVIGMVIGGLALIIPSWNDFKEVRAQRTQLAAKGGEIAELKATAKKQEAVVAGLFSERATYLQMLLDEDAELFECKERRVADRWFWRKFGSRTVVVEGVDGR